jgi:RNA 2',3'-cyclic 3'-phosphodiesterase
VSVDSYRTFIAIELPPAVRAKLIEHVARLRRELPDARASWSREHNLHLTLKFLGNVPVSEIAKLSDAVERAVSRVRPFELTVSGCGVFPPKGRPNVLWIGVSEPPVLREDIPSELQDAGELRLLHEQVENECSKLGFPREQRAFHPHLTVARLRKTGGERRLGNAHKTLAFPSATFPVSEVVVFKSELLREGSKHTAISRHSLQNSDHEPSATQPSFLDGR